jgi:hypothetical protein
MWEKWGDGDVTRLEMKKKTERKWGNSIHTHTSTRDNVLVTHWEISSLLILWFSHTMSRHPLNHDFHYTL